MQHQVAIHAGNRNRPWRGEFRTAVEHSAHAEKVERLPQRIGNRRQYNIHPLIIAGYRLMLWTNGHHLKTRSSCWCAGYGAF
jgi:hypothetical protein